MQPTLLDAAGRHRSPATTPGYHRGRAPRNKGLRYPADPPTIEEIVTVMRAAGNGSDGARIRAPIVILWRAGLRIGEALALAETDLERSRGAMLVRRGKGGRRREVGMDRWAWDQLDPWLEIRAQLPVGALLCVIRGATGGRHWEPSSARKQLRRIAAIAGVRRRFAPHQLRHAHAVEMAHEGVPLVVIQRQLGHANLGITSIYLQGIDSSEIVETVHSRPARDLRHCWATQSGPNASRVELREHQEAGRLGPLSSAQCGIWMDGAEYRGASGAGVANAAPRSADWF